MFHKKENFLYDITVSYFIIGKIYFGLLKYYLFIKMRTRKRDWDFFFFGGNKLLACNYVCCTVLAMKNTDVYKDKIAWEWIKRVLSDTQIHLLSNAKFGN